MKIIEASLSGKGGRRWARLYKSFAQINLARGEDNGGEGGGGPPLLKARLTVNYCLKRATVWDKEKERKKLRLKWISCFLSDYYHPSLPLQRSSYHLVNCFAAVSAYGNICREMLIPLKFHLFLFMDGKYLMNGGKSGDNRVRSDTHSIILFYNWKKLESEIIGIKLIF